MKFLNLVEDFGNIGKPIIDVKHAELERWSEDSAYKSKCSVCPDGLLLVCRNPETLELSEIDCCILCGQRFRYLDINNLREGGK